MPRLFEQAAHSNTLTFERNPFHVKQRIYE
jgi:hypothetical protein